MQVDNERDTAIIGHLLTVRSVAQALATNIDACLELILGSNDLKSAANVAAELCMHRSKITYQTAGSDKTVWNCPECGARGEY